MKRFELIIGKTVLLTYRPDVVDDRDYRLQTSPPIRLPRAVDNRAEVREILDQEWEGACTGFAVCTAAELLFGRYSDEAGGAPDLSERWAYRRARQNDPWPGENYHGSTMRAALVGWHRHGLCEDRYWPYVPYSVSDRSPAFDLVGWEGAPREGAAENAGAYRLSAYFRLRTVFDIRRAIHEHHVVLIGANIHSGWDLKEGDRIVFNERSYYIGGHAFALVGYDDNDGTFLVANSWGKDWGDGGFARLTYEDLRVNRIDAWAAIVPGPLTQ